MVIDEILSTLVKAPLLLKDLIDSIPREMIKKRRIEGKWCIHEHACHLVNGQPMLTGRLKQFINEDAPVFKSYLPGTTTPPDELMKMDLENMPAAFPRLRAEFVELYKRLAPDDWHKKVEHPQYTDYNPYIMARHVMFHDQTHMYRIEELWLQREF
ncbi:MAG: DinB family protein [Nitrospinota bacterium]